MLTTRSRPSKVPWVAAIFLAAVLFTPLIAGAATPAGTLITNVATANWTDTNNNPYSQASNTTTVTVTSVFGVGLTGGGAQNGVPLDNVSYGYRIENTGNATDNYALAAASVPGWPTSMIVDDNGDGIHQPTEVTVVSSPITITAGDNAFIFVVVTIPAGTANSTTSAATLNVTGEGIVGVFTDGDDATDSSTTTCQAPLLGVLKNVRNTAAGPSFDNTATAAPTETLEYRIRVTNTGAAAATSVVLTDSDNANTTYVPGSMRIGPGLNYGDAGNLYPGDGNTDSAFPMPCAADICGHGHVTAGNITAYLGNTSNDGAAGPGGTLPAGSTIYIFFQVTVD